jgi:ubiquitin carboxyl-terminal hydrolase 14
MVMGTAGELPKPPPNPVQFLEDMTDAEVAEAVSYSLRNFFFL